MIWSVSMLSPTTNTLLVSFCAMELLERISGQVRGGLRRCRCALTRQGNVVNGGNVACGSHRGASAAARGRPGGGRRALARQGNGGNGGNVGCGSHRGASDGRRSGGWGPEGDNRR